MGATGYQDSRGEATQFANMAKPWQMPQCLSPSKAFFRLVVVVAIVIFILGKLLNDNDSDETKLPSHGSSVDERIQNFDLNKVPKQAPGEIGNASNAKLSGGSKRKSSQPNSAWNFTHTQTNDEIYVLIPLANVKSSPNLRTKFQICVTSMSELSSAQIVLFVVGDEESRGVAESVVKSLVKKNVQLQHVDLKALSEEMKDVINTLQQHFSYKPGSYYSHTLFFLSSAIHRLAPPTLSHLIMLDADLNFKADIKLLHDHFSQFSPSNVMGIAYENQPVYRHVLSVYRQSHPGTRAGDPAPKGNPGFNSGVLLMDLDRMRKSERYNTLLDSDIVEKLAQKYSYKGHLGDQDFYTLVSLENEDLFYVLPCTWNRQLCQWWRDKGYEKVFDSYFTCQGKINIYHGNCNTPFPAD